jgi:hypothetical protein
MKFLFLATNQVGRGRMNELLRLIKSIEQQDNKDHTIALHVLLQGTATTPVELSEFTNVNFYPNPEFVGLSKARNLLLERIEIAEDDLILFPDDDCWYPAQFISCIASLIREKKPDLAVWRFSIKAQVPSELRFTRMSGAQALRTACSIAFVIRGAILNRIGPFDENLGLGTEIGGGEDTDYAFRAFSVASCSLVSEHELVFHRSIKDSIEERSKYWKANMYLAIRYFGPAIFALTLYRLFGGLFLLLRGHIDLSTFIQPFRTAARG